MKEDKFAESKRFMFDLNSPKNADVVQKILSRDKSKYNKIIDYLCAAVRDFNEDSTEKINIREIEMIVNKMMDEKLKNMNITSSTKEELVVTLEDNLDNIDIEED